MTKWARISEFNTVDEVIDYNPIGTINEELLYLFKECPEDTQRGYQYLPEINLYRQVSPFPSWIYDETTKTWNPPIPYPDPSDPNYIWSEENKNWISISSLE